MILTLLPNGIPTDPGFRVAGGIGFARIGAADSVNPIDSNIGIPKVFSKSSSIEAGMADDADRANLKQEVSRSFCSPPLACTSSSKYLVMVGTVLNQVQ